MKSTIIKNILTFRVLSDFRVFGLNFLVKQIKS